MDYNIYIYNMFIMMTIIKLDYFIIYTLGDYIIKLKGINGKVVKTQV